jgi:hypothetical protein
MNTIKSAGNYVFCMENKMNIINCEQGIVHQRIVSADNRIDFVSDRMLYNSSESSLV